MRYCLIKSKDNKIFEFDKELIVNEDKIKTIPHFRDILLNDNIEIFKEYSCQFMTEEGLYMIVGEDEIEIDS